MPKDGVDWKAEEEYLREIGYTVKPQERFPFRVPRLAYLAVPALCLVCALAELVQARWVDAALTLFLGGLAVVITRPSKFWIRFW